MSLPKFIVEDGSCVPDANTFATVECGQKYFAGNPDGWPWNGNSQKGACKEEDLCGALLWAARWMRTMKWINNCCCANDLPSPRDCSCQNRCDKDRVPTRKLKNAQLEIANAYLRGWRPFKGSGGKSADDILITGFTQPDEANFSFAEAVRFGQIKEAFSEDCEVKEKEPTNAELRYELFCYLRADLKCYLAPRSRTRSVIC